ncbi:MAG TPA: glycine--tRNA ligase subunit beta, partial [Xanthomonadales bacterium]|nr:glycine--tRNA ligase subunit beta [Xanthomonadales bacterium]
RWSGHAFSFVRPVHWLVVLHGSRVIQGSLFEQAAGNTTQGHRVHSPGPHPIAAADRYEAVLEPASVLVDPALRKTRVCEAVTAAAAESGGQARITDALLSEVCNIVEWPVAVACSFEPAFLEVPQEALIASMEDHQKFFPVLDKKSQALAPHFVAVANLESQDPALVRDGFERVIRPRLADARFFWDQDRQRPLQDYVERLEGVLFQPKLGSVRDKTKRIEDFSRIIAQIIDIDPEPVARAALLCKCDLVTQMVGEFPGLQGIMGGHYASASGEPDAVALAIREHYSPRYAGDAIPASDAGRVLALADRLDTLVGIFASGAKPSGNKDPFALRRAALGAARIMLEAPLPIGLDELFNAAARCLEPRLAVPAECLSEARDFLLERVRQHFLETGYRTSQVNAALAAPLTTLPDLAARLSALAAFMALPEAEQLVAANKRIGNILGASESTISGEINENRLVLDEERRLFDQVVALERQLEPHFEAGEYEQALAALAGLDRVIAPFFDQVMVMDEDPAIRNNRLALLFRLKSLFDRIADLSVVG